MSTSFSSEASSQSSTPLATASSPHDSTLDSAASLSDSDSHVRLRLLIEEGQWKSDQFDDMWWCVKDWARRFEGATLVHHSKHTLHQSTCPYAAINKGKQKSTPAQGHIIVILQSHFAESLIFWQSKTRHNIVKGWLDSADTSHPLILNALLSLL